MDLKPKKLLYRVIIFPSLTPRKAIIYQCLFVLPLLLLRSERTINEGKKDSGKTQGKPAFYYLGSYRVYSTHFINDWLDDIYGIFYGLKD
tara:strand:- start:702 stop:971 length:270 start_codon:yes stop_codon:yes gene_type:complete